MTRTHSSLICTPLTMPSHEAMKQAMVAEYPLQDVYELRLDYLESVHLPSLLEKHNLPVLATLRLPQDGGFWKGSEAERIRLLEQADDLGADYIDIEIDRIRTFHARGKAKVIVSCHNFQETPQSLPDLVKRMEDTNADIVKVATIAKDHRDNVRMIEVLESSQKPIIGVTMGPHGHVMRILGPKFGAFLVFASLGKGKESAPGQVPVMDLVCGYRFREIQPATHIYALVDHPEGYVLSMQINQVLSREKINALVLPAQSSEDRSFSLGERSDTTLIRNGMSFPEPLDALLKAEDIHV